MPDKVLSMLLILGLLLWTLGLLLIARLIWIGRASILATRWQFWSWLIIILAALLLLGRPHQNIFGGEDPGAYINAGLTYGRQGQFFYNDPLLQLVPAAARSVFYYGHSGYGLTKDACLWISSPEAAIIGPHFQPAYSLLIAALSQIADPLWTLYVVPFFTLLLALALAALASLLLPHSWAGLIAAALFLMNPLTIWHGRCPRPEIIAAFMLCSGAALLLYAWRRRPWSAWSDLLLGLLALGLAPFFHISALYALVPAAIAIAIIAMRGRCDFLLSLPVGLAWLVLFIRQSLLVSDCYRIGRFSFIIVAYQIPAWIILAGAAATITAVCFWSRRRRRRQNSPEDTRPKPTLSWSLALAVLSALFFVALTRYGGNLNSLLIHKRSIEHYLYLSDFPALINMISWPIALLALLGWVAWLSGPRQFRQERLILAMLILPALVFSGRINDFMMTRYWLIALIPMITLSLTALITLIPSQPKMVWLPLLLAGALGWLGLQQRAHLVSLTQYKGLINFLRPYAEIIQRENGILLSEYSRLAAPFEHFFGITTLGLDNQHQDDYAPAERSWETIMRHNPERQAFFLTPFQEPLSERFVFQPVKTGLFQCLNLVQARQQLPTRLGRYQLNLKAYRMSLREDADPTLQQRYQASWDQGNMGFRHFANLRSGDSYSIKGLELPSGASLTLRLPAWPQDQPASEVLALLLSEKAQPAAPTISGLALAGSTPPSFESLANHWWALRSKVSGLSAPDSLTISSADPMLLSELLIVSGEQAIGILGQCAGGSRLQKSMPPITARWMRSQAEVLLPAGAGSLLLMLFEPPQASGPTSRLTLAAGATLPQVTRATQAGCWQWQGWVYPLTLPSHKLAWLKLHAEPAWDPGLADFPNDLGLLIGKIIVLPPL